MKSTDEFMVEGIVLFQLIEKQLKFPERTSQFAHQVLALLHDTSGCYQVAVTLAAFLVPFFPRQVHS